MNYRRLYEYRFRGIDQSSREEVWKEIAAHVYGLMGRPARVLDPAAGRGEFINNIPAPERWAVNSVGYPEHSPEQGTRVIVSDIFDIELPEEHFDGIWVSNFLEHLPTQEVIASFLEKMYAAATRGGRIAVMGPNFRYCTREYFDCADHTLALTHVAIAEHLYAAGFEPVKVVPRYLPYSFRSKLPASRTLTRRYLRMPPAWRFLGKQFLVIGQT
jgi:Methyltransferase domain